VVANAAAPFRRWNQSGLCAIEYTLALEAVRLMADSFAVFDGPTP